MYHLYGGIDLLGTVVPEKEHCDMFWQGGKFIAAPAFATVAELFQEEARLLEGDAMDAWEAVWTKIEEPGLRLVPVDGGEVISDLIIHIEADEARWRF